MTPVSVASRSETATGGGVKDDMPWDQRVREAGYVRGQDARRKGQGRNASE